MSRSNCGCTLAETRLIENVIVISCNQSRIYLGLVPTGLMPLHQFLTPPYRTLFKASPSNFNALLSPQRLLKPLHCPSSLPSPFSASLSPLKAFLTPFPSSFTPLRLPQRLLLVLKRIPYITLLLLPINLNVSPSQFNASWSPFGTFPL